jgi:hypothetical protein
MTIRKGRLRGGNSTLQGKEGMNKKSGRREERPWRASWTSERMKEGIKA